jgi:hypothetical protein
MIRISVLLCVSALLVCSVLPTAAQQQSQTGTPSGNAPCAGVTSDGTGTANKVSKFTAPCNIEPSKITDTGASVSIGELLSLPATGAATTTAGKNSQVLNFTASAFNSGTATPVNQSFRLQGEPVNNNTTSASGTLNVLFAQGTATPAETGVSFSKTGNVTARRFTSTVPTGTAPLTVTSTTLVPNLNAGFLGGFAPGAFARLVANNNFTGNQSITGNLGATGLISGGAGTFGGNLSVGGNFGTSGNGTFSGGLGVGGGLSVGAGQTVTGSIQFTDDGVHGDLQPPLLVNALDCCDFGNRMIWAHSPSFSQWGIYYDDVIDNIIVQTSLSNQVAFFDFAGDLTLNGTLTAAAKNFKIDHPLDPTNKYLSHTSVESSEMMNIYTGNAILDNSGEALVSLPKWFEALNADFRYQLTAIGAAAPNLHVAQEIAHHQFIIAGGAPGMKVSWQVTGVRHDAYAKAHPLVVEVKKSDRERGHYLNPDAFGAPRLTQEQMSAQRSR